MKHGQKRLTELDECWPDINASPEYVEAYFADSFVDFGRCDHSWGREHIAATRVRKNAGQSLP